MLAGRAVHDIDVAVALPPDTVAARLRAAGLGVHPTGLAHGTLTATVAGEPVEVTTLRRDLETDGRHATVAWTDDWRQDAARRDFTINAMSLAADGSLWDYFEGRADLLAGRVRFVGDPAVRLAEDYLRALRYFRFFARYGIGPPDDAAVAAIGAAVPGLARLSAERVWMEIKRLLVAPDPTAALQLMQRTGVLGAVLPEGADPARLAPLIGDGLPPEPVLRLAVLVPLGVAAATLGPRLRWSAEEAARFDALRAIEAAPVPGGIRPVDRRLRAWRAVVRQRAAGVAPPEPLWIAEAERGGDGWGALRDALTDGDDPIFPLHGRDLLRLGVPPGPAVGRLLAAARDYWLDRDCDVSATELQAHLAHLAAPP